MEVSESSFAWGADGAGADAGGRIVMAIVLEMAARLEGFDGRVCSNISGGCASSRSWVLVRLQGSI